MEDSALPLVEVLVGRWTNVMLAECPFGHQQVEALSAVVEAWYGGCLTTRASSFLGSWMFHLSDSSPGDTR